MFRVGGGGRESCWYFAGLDQAREIGKGGGVEGGAGSLGAIIVSFSGRCGGWRVGGRV